MGCKEQIEVVSLFPDFIFQKSVSFKMHNNDMTNNINVK
jgi:hypothetical protein